MMITMMIVLVFISDGSSTAAGLVRCCGSSSSGQRSRIVTIGSDDIAAMLFAHLRKSSDVSVLLAPVGTGLGSTTSTFTSGLGLVLALCDASTGFALAAATFLRRARPRRGIPAATLAMPVQIRGAIDVACLRFGHAVFRCMGDGWRQQQYNSNGDNTHVRHDREPYLFYVPRQSYRSVGRPQRNLRVKLGD